MGGAVGRKLSEKLSGVGLDVEQACGLVPPIAPQSRDGQGGGHLVCPSFLFQNAMGSLSFPLSSGVWNNS